MPAPFPATPDIERAGLVLDDPCHILVRNGAIPTCRRHPVARAVIRETRRERTGRHLPCHFAGAVPPVFTENVRHHLAACIPDRVIG